MIQCIIFKFRKWHTCNYEWYRLFRSYENCRRPGVAILDMQISKVPIISGYVLLKVALSTINLNIHYNSQSYYVFYRSRGHSDTCTYLYKYLITDKAMQYTPISVCSVVSRVKMSCLSGHVKNVFKQWLVYYVYIA